ncbi:MAG TPA: YkgJ family cysteine cluster protein [Xanthobacteraceae bacterium]
MVLSTRPAQLSAADCQTCGACCSFSAEWPRFSLESDTDLNQIPRVYVNDEQGRMRCSGNRCAALRGDVGISTTCAIYAMRPDVCKACLPGDDACQMARRNFGLQPIELRPGYIDGAIPLPAF